MKNDSNDLGRQMSDIEIMKRLSAYIKPFIKPLLISLIMIIFITLFDLATPLLISMAVTFLAMPEVNFTYIVLIIVLFLSIIAVSSFISYIETMILQKSGQKIMYNVREEVFTHIEGLSISQINSIPVGKLVTRVTSDTNALNNLYTNVIINLIKNCLSIIFVIILMFIASWKLALIVLCVTPLVAIFSIIFRKYSRRAYREVRGNISGMNAFLSENISGMKIIQIFNQEKKKGKEFDENNDKLRRSQLKEINVFAIFRPAIYLLYIATVGVVLYVGFSDLLSNMGNLTATEFAAELGIITLIYQYIERLFNPIQQLADQFNTLQSAFASSERIFEILDTKPLIYDEEDAIELDSIKGEIEFKNVWFQYKKDEWILKDVSFHVLPKQTVAFVGATGAGKTTILSLIVRNYDIQRGQILIDGIDIKKIKLSSLRKGIGQMLQDVFLFSGTVNSNIRLFDETIKDMEIKEACKYVNATSFIEKLEHQYEEPIRERGNNLSAGQRQLLSFARTIVHKPSIMILDEATANIDTETEQLIQKSLENMMNIGTMLVVAHRLSTIQHADNIIVMNHGQIVEQGNHQELLKQKGRYYDLYRLQFAKKSLENVKS